MESRLKETVLVVDDDPDILTALTNRLRWLGYHTITAQDGVQALLLIQQTNPDLVLLDLELPRLSGLDVIRRLQSPLENHATRVSGNTLPPIIMLSAYATVGRAVEAVKLGAQEFLTKPFDQDHLDLIIKKSLEQRALAREIGFLRTEVGSRYEIIVGESAVMRQVIETAKRTAPADLAMLLLGETGTGKELLARSIHRWSPRKKGPFMAINCAALPESLLENELFGHEKGAFSGATTMQVGKLEAAHRGTVFLDEIGDMPITLQTRLLRILQDKEFHRLGGTTAIRPDVRFIAATNHDLRARVAQGLFREDLFYRLNVMPLCVPPLRDRGEDIGLLAEMILAREAGNMKIAKKPLSQEAQQCLALYKWPGNIRELENVLSRALLLSSRAEIGPEDLGIRTPAGRPASPPPATQELPYHVSLEAYSRWLLEEALHRSNGNRTQAAELLQLQRTYFIKLLRKKQIAGTLPHADEHAASTVTDNVT